MRAPQTSVPHVPQTPTENPSDDKQKTTDLEFEARSLFRDVLAHHYIEGHPCGKDALKWLLKHGGYLPDPQEVYGDGTPLTQPADEGNDMKSPSIEVLCEAGEILNKLEGWEDEGGEHITRQVKELRAKWPKI